MNYERVLPRDLFNESKLLKCLGQLSLLIHDSTRLSLLIQFEHEESDKGFEICMDKDSGYIYCTNLQLLYNDTVISLYTPYNSREPYPLYFDCYYACNEVTGSVLTDDGQLTAEFLAFIEQRG